MMRPSQSPDPAGAPPSSSRSTEPRGRARRPRRAWWAYLVLLPSLALLAVFGFYPGLSAMFWSFWDWRPAFDSIFIGFDNYIAMTQDEIWLRAFGNLAIIFVAAVTAMWLFPLVAAELVITLRSPRLQFVFRTLLIIPLAFPGVVTVLLWGFIYDPNSGILNELLEMLGLGALQGNWLGNPDTALAALIFVQFPWIASLPFLVFLTGLQNIPTEIFEASQIDGAGRIRRFFSIDFPMLLGQFRLLFFLAIVQVLQFGFSAYLLTAGGPDNATMVPVLRALNMAFQASEWGYAAALSTTLFVIILGLSLLSLLLGRRRKETSDV